MDAGDAYRLEATRQKLQDLQNQIAYLDEQADALGTSGQVSPMAMWQAQ